MTQAIQTRDPEAYVRNGRVLLSTTVDLGDLDEAESTMAHFPEHVRVVIRAAMESEVEERIEAERCRGESELVATSTYDESRF